MSDFAMRTGLAEAWWARINRAEENQEWLLVKTNRANCRRWDGQYAESEHLQRKVLCASRKEPSEEHPSTLTTKANLAPSLRLRGKNAEAERIEHDVLGVERRALGEEHPSTRITANNLTAPSGTRVLMQRLAEHSRKLARVLWFDELGRYAVGLDDDKLLSLMPECVVRAGCAAAECASEEARSVCARCQAVRYCSRECQRADWKAHKQACVAAVAAGN